MRQTPNHPPNDPPSENPPSQPDLADIIQKLWEDGQKPKEPGFLDGPGNDATTEWTQPHRA